MALVIRLSHKVGRKSFGAVRVRISDECMYLRDLTRTVQADILSESSISVLFSAFQPWFVSRALLAIEQVANWCQRAMLRRKWACLVIRRQGNLRDSSPIRANGA